MEITNIKVTKVNGRNRLLGYVSVTFDNCFVVHNIALYDTDKGRKIVMPRRRTSKGEYKDVAHPTVNEFREFLTNAISEAYDNS
ncbi:MAG: SpoVG family protein [Spirochaetes bacterium]|jgi:stage V sporulation protein G|nr:SpoVG family protein [Spirochaetota bacterium]